MRRAPGAGGALADAAVPRARERSTPADGYAPCAGVKPLSRRARSRSQRGQRSQRSERPARPLPVGEGGWGAEAQRIRDRRGPDRGRNPLETIVGGRAGRAEIIVPT